MVLDWGLGGVSPQTKTGFLGKAEKADLIPLWQIKSFLATVYVMLNDSDAVPVLLLHGFLGNPEDWAAVCQVLPSAQDVHVYRIQDADQGFEACLSHMVAYMDRCQTPWDIVGYSMGGRLAWFLAYRYPHRVRRLCILSASPGISDPEARRMRGLQDATWCRLLRTLGLTAFLPQWYAQPLFDAFRQHPGFQATLERRYSENAEAHARTLERCSPAVQPDLWAWVLASQIPTLYLCGERDRRYTEVGQRLSANDHLRCEVLSGVGHVLHLEAPVAVAVAITRFLA